MADNLAVSSGSGNTIAADDVGGILFQRVKACLGADGTAVDPSAGAGAVGTGVQRMTLGSDDPAVTSLGVMDDWDSTDACKIVNIGDVISVTLTLDTSAYASGDLLADTQAITAALRVSGGTAKLTSLMVIDEDDQKAAFDVYVTSATATAGTENSAPSISDANARSVQAIIPIATADYKDLGGVSVANIKNIGAMVKGNASADLSVFVVNGAGAPTYTASGVKLVFGFEQN